MKRPRGRPPVAPNMLKIPVCYRLSSWLVEWLRNQPEPAAILIERALIERHKLKKPAPQPESPPEHDT